MSPDSNRKFKLKEGGARLLTIGEISLAATLFKYSIRYNTVWVHLDSYLPFNTQNPKQAMSPNGEMWYREPRYEDDFSMPIYSGRPNAQHLFLHEMMHVWQHQRGMAVRLRGLMSWAADYTYSLDKKNLLDYGLEQQASIVSDYWLLKYFGFRGNSNLFDLRDYNPGEPVSSLMKRYENILGRFPG
ncbi:type IV secretion protein Rhs [Pluralibacter gergoviae]|uniref:Type IV secretion protein Rhs n=1 Tax=Pluralibacter gergoviae TaxID=61647 RepID=A0AAI9GK32_PLUGE|nr:type IV secretion protein Rhs [Pluralibacter gergoviae]EKV0916129.1 type IV secretion protein Rhs [Pluralibacter gergoviae]EKV9908205.1 type IV secretion protein Rhs [Pluralibacter gergoviae]EKW7276953.1 type IV secretion protein Rhs [Pluralibacter gergoviae]ELD4296950.1 type IV secretion protein Rhs [Pluralibacter gergoviae]ELD4307599.1 type IV secretion protein Rhs [Pluralibacter gergoviae]